MLVYLFQTELNELELINLALASVCQHLIIADFMMSILPGKTSNDLLTRAVQLYAFHIFPYYIFTPPSSDSHVTLSPSIAFFTTMADLRA